MWDIDPVHTRVQFSVRHMMIANVRGEFSGVSGTVRVNEAAPADTSIMATIDASSISTRELQRDEHLKSADFLDVLHYPEISFLSRRIQRGPLGSCKVHGELALHGVTREILLLVAPLSEPVRDSWGRWRRGTSAKTRISRRDFGLLWNKILESGGVLVGDEVAIRIEIELIEKENEPAID
jgi:polyisoprenoid-binding protein YceI